MSSEKVEPTAAVHNDDLVGIETLKEHNIHNSNVLVDKDLMLGAYDAENREHTEGVWEAAKAHPMACIWAFIMCFTIVSLTMEFRSV